MKSTLLERYLAAIARNLPLGPERDDVIAEISDELQSRIESGEGSEYEVIKAYGHPRVVAARYKAHQYLIGPTLLPFYWYAIQILLAVVLGLELFGSAITALTLGNPAMFLTGLSSVWSSVIGVIGFVTIGFALAERFGKRFVVPFDPAMLPSTDAQLPRYKSGFEFAANFCMLLVLLFGGHLLIPTIAPFAFTAAWTPAWYATVVATALVCSAAFATYLTPSWMKLRDLTHLVTAIIMVIGLWLMLRDGGPFVVLAGHDASGNDLSQINRMVMWSAGVVAITFAIAGAVSLWKLLPFTTLREAQGKRA